MINHQSTPTDAQTAFTVPVNHGQTVLRGLGFNHSQTVLRGMAVNHSQTVLRGLSVR